MSMKSRKKRRLQEQRVATNSDGAPVKSRRISPERFAMLVRIGKVLLVLLVIISLLFSLISLFGVLRLNRRDNPYVAANNYARVEFFSKNFLTLWLSGDKSTLPQLRKMYDGKLPEIAADPMHIDALNVADIQPPTTIKNTKDRQWNAVVGANVSALGNASIQRMFFKITVHEHGGTFKAEKLPEPVNDVSDVYTITPVFQGGLSLKGPAGVAIQNFISSYYTQNMSGSLGRFVTNNFSARSYSKPVSKTVFTGAQIVSLQTLKVVELSHVNTDGRVDVLVTMKLSSTSSTFVFSQVYVTIQKTSNGQWLVDSLKDQIPSAKGSPEHQSSPVHMGEPEAGGFG